MTAGVLGTLAASGYSLHGGTGWWMGGGMMVWMVFFWVAVVVGIVWFVRLGADARPRVAEDAFGVLDRRFAEGGLSFDEYRDRKAVLRGEHPIL